MKHNKILAVCAATLFLLSFFSYRESVTRAERFERGQKFLPNLNPDEIASISIRKGETSTRLTRQGEDRFVVASSNGYWAYNEAINRFLKDVLELGLEKEVGSGESLYSELELEAGAENTTEVAFTDASGEEMVRFLVGKSFEDGGSYVRRTDEAGGEESMVFLSSRTLSLSADGDSFVDKEILDVEEEKITRVVGRDFVIQRQDGELQLADVPEGQKESSKVFQVKGLLRGLRFTQHLLANEPEVLGLTFEDQLEVELDDQTGYRVAVATRGEKHYLRVEGFQTAEEQLSIAMDASEEEVRETSEILARGDEIREFNEFHGSWIYEVTETLADKVRLTRSDLLEKA